MYKNLEKGKPYRSFAFESNVSLLNKAQCVSLVVGSDSLESDVVINNLKQKELLDSEAFVEANPEVNLPSVLNIEATFKEFPPLVSIQKTPLKDTEIDNRGSWAEVVSKDNSLNKHLNGQNGRFILEC